MPQINQIEFEHLPMNLNILNVMTDKESKFRQALNNEMNLFEINPGFGLKQEPGLGPSNSPTDHFRTNKHNKSGTHSKTNHCCDQIHA